jgi:hypothetical protein
MNSNLDQDLKITRARLASERKSIAARQFIHEYVIALQEDERAEFRDFCSTIENNSDTSEGVLRCEPLGIGAFSVRLRGTTSVRDMLKKHSISHLDCAILRTGLGEDRKGLFYDFLQ